MRDYKARPGRKGRKPARPAPAPRRKARVPELPRGFVPLTRPPEARHAPPPRLRGLLRSARRIPLRAVLLGAALAWLAAGLVAGTVALWQSPLEEVQLAGNAAVSAQTVLELGGLAAGLPMSRLEPYALARRIAAHPRLLSADVRRVYPGRLRVRVHERQAQLRVALEDGRTAVVDGDDVVLSVLPAGAPVPETLAGLPLVRGAAASAAPSEPLHDPALTRGRRARVALEELDFPDAGRIVVDGRDPFLVRLILPDGQRLIAPEQHLEPALRTWRTLRERVPALLARAGTVDLAELRSEGHGRVYLRPH